MITKEMRELIKSKDAKGLSKILFDFDLTPTQVRFAYDVLFNDKVKRITISAMTRYGKSQVIAITVGIYLLLAEHKKVFFIAPTKDQATILRNYLNELVMKCPLLLEISDMVLETTEDRFKKEVSKSRVTFKNGNEYRVFTAGTDGAGMMGFGLNLGGLIIIDEACMIPTLAYTKIIRMLGDNPDDSKIIELYNPWDKDNKAYEHSINPDWTHYQVGYETAIKEGRVDPGFVESQRKELTPIEFTVLYESHFPDTSEDSIFTYQRVKESVEKPIDQTKAIRIIACDVADKGLDRTVIMRGYKNEIGEFRVEEIYSEPISDNMGVAGKIVDWYNEYGADKINIDTIGIGVGVVSRVREEIGKKVTVNACHYGEGVGTAGKENKSYPSERLEERKPESGRKRFSNRKAEQYFRLRDLFEDGEVSIPKQTTLFTELMNMKWELTGSGKIKILDPESKSPDYADALVYFIWEVTNQVVMDFG